MKKTPASVLHWPDDYRQWSGDFRALVETAAEVLRALEPTAKAPNERLLRYYQQQGVLGRGRKEGNRSVFTFEDLDRVVAAKALVNNSWTLEHAATLFANTPPAETAPAGYAGLVYGVSAPGSEEKIASALNLSAGLSTPPVHAFHAATAPGAPSSAMAQSVVEKLLRGGSASLLRSTPPKASANVASMSLPSIAAAPSLLDLNPPAVLTVSPGPADPSLRQAWNPVPWLSITLDPAALSNASDAERVQARQALEAVLRRIS